MWWPPQASILALRVESGRKRRRRLAQRGIRGLIPHIQDGYHRVQGISAPATSLSVPVNQHKGGSRTMAQSETNGAKTGLFRVSRAEREKTQTHRNPGASIQRTKALAPKAQPPLWRRCVGEGKKSAGGWGGGGRGRVEGYEVERGGRLTRWCRQEALASAVQFDTSRIVRERTVK